MHFQSSSEITVDVTDFILRKVGVGPLQTCDPELSCLLVNDFLREWDLFGGWISLWYFTELWPCPGEPTGLTFDVVDQPVAMLDLRLIVGDRIFDLLFCQLGTSSGITQVEHCH